MTRHLPLAALLLAAPVIAPGAARADDSYTLTLKNHVFEPDTLHIPAGVPHTARALGNEPMRAVVAYNAGDRHFKALEGKQQ